MFLSDLCVWISRATTSGTRSASCSTTGSGISKLINYHRKFVSVQSASTYGCHPHPTSLPSLTEQRGLLAMAAMACRPPGPHSPFGQRRELRIVSYNVKMGCSKARMQQPEQLLTNHDCTAPPRTNSPAPQTSPFRRSGIRRSRYNTVRRCSPISWVC